MPIFEFRCKRCEKEFEFFLMRKDEEILCPFCGGEEVEKLISLFGLASSASGGETTSSGACSACFSKNCSTCR